MSVCRLPQLPQKRQDAVGRIRVTARGRVDSTQPGTNNLEDLEAISRVSLYSVYATGTALKLHQETKTRAKSSKRERPHSRLR